MNAVRCVSRGNFEVVISRFFGNNFFLRYYSGS